MTHATRDEQDSMGVMQVPADAYYGAQTARAVENFPISSLRLGRRFISALGIIKLAAAQVNCQLGGLTAEVRSLIEKASREVMDGSLDGQFVVDVFQTGSGTSTNMNANEVIAGRANELAGGSRGGRSPVHPNDHVNMRQSSNDVIPTAMHIAIAVAIQMDLIPALEGLEKSLHRKAIEYDDVVKIGRTHLQDATPIRLGQELSGYAAQAKLAGARADRAIQSLRELPLGGTAVGTGINSHPDFAAKAIEIIAQQSGIDFVEADNHFEAQAAKDAIVEASGLLKSIAIGLAKIANDIRWLAAGPRCGIGEIAIPATQPGSSIMPGKVNPVMSEMLLQVCAKVIGNDATVTMAAGPLGSNFELNVMMPVTAYCMIETVELLAAATQQFARRCVDGITANRERCAAMVEQSLALCTPLAPLIGYDRAAEIAKESFKTGRTVRDIATEQRVLDAGALKRALDPVRMTEPHDSD